MILGNISARRTLAMISVAFKIRGSFYTRRGLTHNPPLPDLTPLLSLVHLDLAMESSQSRVSNL